jgi:uncharacterized membrane protein HdeD (DUF308 family)
VGARHPRGPVRGRRIWCFAQPIEAFWALAAVFGLLLILRGSFDIVTSATTHDVNPI